MPDDLNYTALAGILDETLASRSSAGGPQPDHPGPCLLYFGDYTLEHEIARGGMGVVYRAKQRTLNRTVAVKVLRNQAFARGDEVERFRLEAAAAAALRHPNVVGIHEIGEHEGTHFFSMDYVDGPSLAAVLRDGPLPPRKAAALLVKIAQAIHHAHAHGVLHRDIKPANVLLDPSGEPMVTDFGLARHTSRETVLTLSGQVLGTPAYMAPEQAAGRSSECDARTDVYGLGALLYHMTSGRAPFTGDSHLAVMSQVTKNEPVSLRLLNPSIPRDLDTVCAKAMAKEPPRRYASAREMADDLQRFLDGRTVLARPVGSLGKAWRWARRHRALAGALAATILSLATAAAVAALSAQRLRTSRDAEAKSRRAAESLIEDMLVGMRDKLQPLNKVELLEDAAAAAERYFDSLPHPVHAGTEQQRATMLETRGDVLSAQGNLPAAIEKQQASLAILERLLKADPARAELLNDTAHAANTLAWLYRRQGRSPENLLHLGRAFELYNRLLPLQGAGAQVRRSRDLAACAYAEALAQAGSKDEALKILLPLREPGAAPAPDESSVAALDAAAERAINLGDAIWYAGMTAESGEEYRKALAFAEKADALNPGQLTQQRRLITSLERMTDMLLDAGDHSGALDLARRRLGISETLSAGDPANLMHLGDVAAAHGRIGLVAKRLNDTATALTSARKSRATYEALSRRDPSNRRHRAAIAIQWMDEADLLAGSDDSACLLAYGEAGKVTAALLGEEPQNRDYRRNAVVIGLNTALVHQQQGRISEAIAAARSAASANDALRHDFPESTTHARDGETISALLKELETGGSGK